MADVLSAHSRVRAELGAKIGARLARELAPHWRDFDVMASFVPYFMEEGDEDAIKALYGAEIGRDAIQAVQSYCDWVAAGIVRSGGYAARPIPVPDAVDQARMAAKGPIHPLTLIYVIDRLREEDSLPLIGRIDQGCLIPDRRELDAWRACFDWGGASTP